MAPLRETVFTLVMCLTFACGESPSASVPVTPAERGSTTAELDPAPTRVEPGGTSTGLDRDDTVGFIVSTDAGPTNECSLWHQDCAVGEKCTVWANDGGAVWNAAACRPLQPQPDRKGEPCWARGMSGHDSCELGTFCWDVDPDTELGMCVAFCTGSAAAPTCDDPNDECSVGKSVLSLCLPRCDPLDDQCPVGCACYGQDRTFQCLPDASGDAGAVGDPCEFINACASGTACVNAAGVPGCTGSSGCCSALCPLGDHDDVSECLPGQSCIPWFEEGAAPPDFEHVGICFIPQ